MRNLVVAVIASVAVAGLAGAAAADAPARGSLVVPVVGERGGSVYCTRNLAPTVAAPIEGGGYRVTGLRPGRYVVRLRLPHETIDMLAVVPVEGEVVVPPVVARGRCVSVEVVARTATPTDDAAPMWSVRFGRSYSPRGAPRLAAVTWAPRGPLASTRSH